MDATDVLASVARAYAELKALSVEIVSVIGSGDEGNSSRGGQRFNAWFETSDKVRIEQSDGQGLVVATDGGDEHAFSGSSRRYLKTTGNQREYVPGLFRADRATRAAILPYFCSPKLRTASFRLRFWPGEPSSLLISVIYEQPPDCSLWLSSAVRYSIDSRTWLVSRIEGEVSIRRPAHDRTEVRKQTVSFENAIVDEPISPDVFTFVPPADAVDAASDPVGCGTFGGGVGRAFTNTDRKAAL